MSKGSFTQDPQSTAGLRRPGGHLPALAGIWRKLQERMPSTVVSPGLSSQPATQQTQLRSGAAESSIGRSPAMSHLWILLLLYMREQEKIPSPTLPIAERCYRHISPTETYRPFRLSPKQHSNLCMIASLEKTTKTHSTLFRGAQNRCRRESKTQTDFGFKRC